MALVMLDLPQLTGKQRQFLLLLQQQETVGSLRSHCAHHGFDFNFIKGFLLSGVLEGYIQWQEHAQSTWVVTAKGASLEGQLPGVELAEQILAGKTHWASLQDAMGSAFSLSFGALRREAAVDVTGQGETARINVLKPGVLRDYQNRQRVFSAVANGVSPGPVDTVQVTWLQEQGYVTQKNELDYRLTVLPPLQTLDLKPMVTTLTSELILTGQWQQIDLKPYDIQTEVPDIAYGRPTILTQCIQRIRDIFLNMGFDEMSGYIVESAFWNFDALFTPQDHPAREVQDTFYLADPQVVPLPPDQAFVDRVKQVHESNYGGEWTEAEASRAILRAHTTTSTARRLYQLQGQDGKYFSIDKVFRNETVDRTHLAEFHQIEGVVVGELLSVRTLMGYLTYFYERLGFQNLKFKPTYNPYTEPSLEVFAYHPPSDRYIEIGNSGLFRQEMLTPLGCGNKSTVAWGLGLERIAMLLYGVEKLSDLVGPEIRLQG